MKPAKISGAENAVNRNISCRNIAKSYTQFLCICYHKTSHYQCQYKHTFLN